MSEEKKEAKATEPAAAETASTSATAKEVGPSKTYHARYWLEPVAGHGRCFDETVEAISPGHAETEILTKHKGMVVKDLVISEI